MKMVLLLINLFIISKLTSQPNEYSSQLIGQNSFIKFPPGISNIGSQLVTTEGCASICNSSGNLLFYSDGVRVWDRFHNQMSNGFGLLGNTSSSQSSLIFKMPDSDNMYYIFTAPETSTNNSIHYNIVSTDANSGNGDVILKNLLPFMMNIQSTEKLTFTYHCNNKDIWVLSKDRNNNTYRSWLITSSGLSSWTFTNIGFSIGNTIQSNIGCMKISTDGSKLAVCHYGDNRVYLYDFNNETGVVSNERLLSSTFIGPYGCEFSENSRYLYVGYNNGLNIHRYDVTNINPSSTRTTIVSNIGLFVGQFQRIGSIIYIAQFNTFFLDAIINSDNGGTFIQNYLPTLNRINFGLNQILYPNLTEEPIIMTN